MTSGPGQPETEPDGHPSAGGRGSRTDAGPSRGGRATVGWLAAIALAGVALRVLGLDWGLPNQIALGEPPFHPDELVAYQRGIELYTKPEGTTFIWGGGLYMRVSHAVHAAVTALAAPPVERDAPATLLALRALNVVFALVTAALVARMAHSVGGRLVALLAAALVLCVPNHVLDSHYARPDVLLAMLCTASLACAVRAARSGSLGWLAVGGLWGGLATATMLSGGIAFGPLAVAFLEARRSAGGGFEPRAFAFAALRAGGAVGGGFALGWLAGNTEALFHWDAFLDGVGISTGSHNAGRYSLPTKLLTRVPPYAFGVPATLAAAVGLGVLIARGLGQTGAPAREASGGRQRVIRKPGALTIASSVITGYALLGRAGGDMMRHLLFLTPAVAIAAAIGIAAVGERLARSKEAPGKRPANASLALAAFVVLWTAQLSALYVWPMAFDIDARYRAGRWIADNVPAGSDLGLTTSFYGDWTYSPRVPPTARIRSHPLMVRKNFDTSSYLDLPLHFIATSDYARIHAGGETAPAFFDDLFEGEHYRLRHTAGPRRGPLSLAAELGLRPPGDLFYSRSTFYIFERVGP